MAFTKTNLTTEWTLIGDNVTDLTFQNVGQYPIYINFNSSNTAPSESVGLVYGAYTGELKKTVTELTYKATPNYVYARSVSANTAVVVETS